MNENCHFCGENICFRNINGRPTPLHSPGGDCPGKRFYRVEAQDCCHPTNCPVCGADVYFIRHNGGCAWFDDLGAPWEKHACFASDDIVLPHGWRTVEGAQNWEIRFVQSIGVVRHFEGPVFGLRKRRQRKALGYKFVRQYKTPGDQSVIDRFESLHGKSVLVNLTTFEVVSSEGERWIIERHYPVYVGSTGPNDPPDDP